MPRPRRLLFISLCALAIAVTLIAGDWRYPAAVPPAWKLDMQLPGILIVLYTGWFIGPASTILTPPVVCILTIVINAWVYFAFAKVFLFFYRQLRGKRQAS